MVDLKFKLILKFSIFTFREFTKGKRLKREGINLLKKLILCKAKIESRVLLKTFY